jgi:hypothetical protein
MKKSLFIIPLLFAALGAPTVVRADITYDFDLTVGAGSVSGTITTDGTIGGIGAGNIAGWNLTLADGTNTLVLTPFNSSVTVSGCCGGALTATPTDLAFNFGLSESYGAQFDFNGIDSTVGELCLSFYCSEGDGIEISNLDSVGDNVFVDEFPPLYTGTEIATVTPEPGTAILWLTGVVLMILMRKRLAQLLRLDTGGAAAQ